MDKKFSIFQFNKKNEEVIEIDESMIDKKRVPKHIAFIMDGNGRWAAKRNMPRTYGHKAGVETIREVVKECVKLGVEYITLYAFSTENWKRPEEEVSTLMNLLVQYLRTEIEEFHKNNLRVNAIGNLSHLPNICQKELLKAAETTKNNTGMMINVALNYGGRNEILEATKKIANEVKSGELEISDISEETIASHMYTRSIPDPELMIRTSGEQRLSNFLLWQLAYSELWFTNDYWPDFKGPQLRKAIYEYQNRDRRFGGIK